MVKNLIDFELTKESEDSSIQNIRSTEALLPFLVNLSLEVTGRNLPPGKETFPRREDISVDN